MAKAKFERTKPMLISVPLATLTTARPLLRGYHQVPFPLRTAPTNFWHTTRSTTLPKRRREAITINTRHVEYQTDQPSLCAMLTARATPTM